MKSKWQIFLCIALLKKTAEIFEYYKYKVVNIGIEPKQGNNDLYRDTDIN
jgi:hypothetical protein